jgi:nucleoside-triphosphatase
MFGVSQKVLVTGRPGCGKTTLIKRVLDELPQRFGGFYTGEIRDHGTRVGFKVVALEGGEAVFAHVDFTTPERVGSMGLISRHSKPSASMPSVKRCRRSDLS